MPTLSNSYSWVLSYLFLIMPMNLFLHPETYHIISTIQNGGQLYCDNISMEFISCVCHSIILLPRPFRTNLNVQLASEKKSYAAFSGNKQMFPEVTRKKIISKFFTSIGKGFFHIQMQQEKDMQKNWKDNYYLINLEKSKNNYQLAMFVWKHSNVL